MSLEICKKINNAAPLQLLPGLLMPAGSAETVTDRQTDRRQTP